MQHTTQFRQPRLDPQYESEFHSLDTIRELPAMPKQSSYGGTYGWQNSLPQIPKSDYPPSWDRQPWWKQLDIEKLIGRTAIVVMALVTLGFGSIFIVKLLQFSIAFTLK
ncbi:MAG TPA: hypothetical protein VHV10_07390 [Ktedonobacteraceae bacterium]|jgi:hypothetical protein|nr:hypothetical protein [Ktedonobacteraceae bacterium]